MKAKRPRIVAIGGGTGLYTLLTGLRHYDVELTSVVAMTDDGGSTGQLRTEFGVLPPGDIRRSIVALSDSPEMMQQLFQYRFEKGTIAGHSFGNLFITALREITGSDETAIDEAARLLHVRGTVLPVTLEDRQLVAELEDGQVVEGEKNIDLPKHNGQLRIRSLSLNQPAKVNPRVVQAIERADMVILGPGDLYGSIIANLIVDGVVPAIASSRAKIVYVCNLMTKFGETNGFYVHDFVRSLEQYLGEGVIDYVLFSRLRPSATVAAAYAKEGAEPVKFDAAALEGLGAEFIQAPLAAKSNLLRHDPAKLAQAIWALLQLDQTISFVGRQRGR